MTKTLQQKLKDKRFRENETKILRLIFLYGDTITMERLAKLMGVKRSTVYRHHKTMREAIEDYMELVVNECVIFCDDNIRKYYFNLLVYVMKNKDVFLVFLKMHEQRWLPVILNKNKQNLLKYAGFYTGLSTKEKKIFTIYSNEIVAVVKIWGESGFCREDFDVVLEDILFLTFNMKVRLGPLCNG